MTDPAKTQHVAGKLAQLLADTLISSHPHLAQLSEHAKADFRQQFLDGLEQHTATMTGPLLQSVANLTDVPPELAVMFKELGVPTEQFSALIGQFFVFGVMFQLASAMLSPFMQQVQNDVWTAHPDRPLSPPDIATAVIRGIPFGSSSKVQVPQWAIDEAKKSGIDPEVFNTMVGVTGMAPALQLLFQMIRRSIINEEQLTEGIKQGDTKDEWIPFVSKLRYAQPSPIDMVTAAVQSQWDELPPGTDVGEWKKWAGILGLEPAGYLEGNPDWFNILYNVHGRPPGPVEMGHAANRGLTPWTGAGSTSLSFAQAIRESDVKTKYIPLLQKLAVYYPPNGEVRTLLMHGGLNESQARAYWQANGVPAELMDAYLHLAEIEQVTQDRALAKGDILTMVQEKAMSDQDALDNLANIGYSGRNAAFLIEMAHYRYELEAIRNAVRKVSVLYVERKITATEAKKGFEGLGMPESQITALLQTLEHQRESVVVTYTAAQVASGLYYQLITQDEAMAMLEKMGYPAWDAWFILSNRMHGKLKNEPPKPQLIG